MRHVDGARIADHLGHVRQSAAVVEMEVRDDHAVDVRCNRSLRNDVREVGKPSFVVVAHVHATVQHNVLAAHRQQQAAPADVLTGAQRSHSNVRHVIGLIPSRPDYANKERETEFNSICLFDLCYLPTLIALFQFMKQQRCGGAVQMIGYKFADPGIRM